MMKKSRNTTARTRWFDEQQQQQPGAPAANRLGRLATAPKLFLLICCCFCFLLLNILIAEGYIQVEISKSAYESTTRSLLDQPLRKLQVEDENENEQNMMNGANVDMDGNKYQKIPVASVAYHVTLTKCTWKFSKTFREDVAVLKHSIELNSYPLNPNSKYSAKFYGIITPKLNNTSCAKLLREENFTVRVFEYPASPETIKPPLNASIAKDGCCGHAELMKLHTYTIDPDLHPISVNLDLDTLLLKPFDTLFDAILYPHDTPEGKVARERLVREGYIAPTYTHYHQEDHNHSIAMIQNQTFHAFYTKDYNMIREGWYEKRVGMQGGFMMVRPNRTVFDELVQIVKDGDFRPGRYKDKGWRGSGYGMHIWGAMTIQGLLGYYYNEHWQTSVELHRCRVNQIADNPCRTSAHWRYPFTTLIVPDNSTRYDTTCRDGRESCDDTQCQNWPINDTTLAHFTYCKHPRECKVKDVSKYQYLNDYACNDMYREWFRTRQSLERHRGMDVPVEDESSYLFNITFGYCDGSGSYRRMK